MSFMLVQPVTGDRQAEPAAASRRRAAGHRPAQVKDPRRFHLENDRLLHERQASSSTSASLSLGFIVGAAIAGQTFYLFTLENLNQFGG